MMVTIFDLGIDLVHLIADAAELEDPVDAKKEAKRLVRAHPEAELSVAEVAETLEEEAEAAGVEVVEREK